MLNLVDDKHLQTFQYIFYKVIKVQSFHLINENN